MAKKPMYIQSGDITVQSGSVTINNQDLADNLNQHSKETLAFLSSEFSPVNMSEVSVDDSGRVVISNSTFASALQGQLSNKLKANGICGLGCAA